LIWYQERSVLAIDNLGHYSNSIYFDHFSCPRAFHCWPSFRIEIQEALFVCKTGGHFFLFLRRRFFLLLALVIFAARVFDIPLRLSL
jgi:hypothetical protein